MHSLHNVANDHFAIKIKNDKIQTLLSHSFFYRFFTKNNCLLKSTTAYIANINDQNHDSNSYCKHNQYNISNNKNVFITKFIDQIHSNIVSIIDDPSMNTSIIQADAIITSLTNILLCISTADCVPILLFVPKFKIIAAIHAGWRGALSGIIQQTVKAIHNITRDAATQHIEDFNNSDNSGNNTSMIIAMIGPCIRQQHYIVDKEFFKIFLEKDAKNKIFFTKVHANNLDVKLYRSHSHSHSHSHSQLPISSTQLPIIDCLKITDCLDYKNHYYKFDLSGYCTFILQKLGINMIYDTLLDTYSNTELFYSYRREYENAKRLALLNDIQFNSKQFMDSFKANRQISAIGLI